MTDKPASPEYFEQLAERAERIGYPEAKVVIALRTAAAQARILEEREKVIDGQDEEIAALARTLQRIREAANGKVPEEVVGEAMRESRYHLFPTLMEKGLQAALRKLLEESGE